MFQLWPKIPLKKVFSNLEPEEQGRGIIKGVTRLLLLGPFYTIKINFIYYFAHDCTYCKRKAWLFLPYELLCYYISGWRLTIRVSIQGVKLDHFGGDHVVFLRLGTRDTDNWQVAHKPLFMRHCDLSVSPVPNLGKMTRSPQSDLT